MYSRFKSAFAVVFFSIGFALAQDCQYQLTGKVIDEGTKEPLEFTSIYIEEIKKGAVTDSNGSFTFDKICSGSYHIVLSHISCTSKEVFVEVKSNIELELVLKHSVHELEDVLLSGSSNTTGNQSAETILAQEITDKASQNLATLIETIPGVSSLKNGNTVAKPIVHGNFGNRLSILNNGVVQSGQQWGNDHSPEIDPLVANKIKVIKGVSALEYLGSNLGSVILIEPGKIEKEPHLHGKGSCFFDSNGLGNGVNFQLQQYKGLGWKINATAKKTGDKKAKDYFLTGTGNQEINVALQLEKEFSDQWKTDFYLSTFNTEIGILAGSQIGNITDLRDAFNSDIPRLTSDSFSYDINAPKQEVSHHLLKLHSKNYLNDTSTLDLSIAGQLNDREEFDVRRNGRTDIPTLSLLQYSFFGEAKYKKNFDRELSLTTGIQTNFVDNTNDPDTGILPLIPDYTSFEWGAFITSRKKWDSDILELGFRYNNSLQDVRRISRDLPRRIIKEDNNFSTISGSASIKHSFTSHTSVIYNIGYSERNPAINELYSFGLHQGVAGVEIGDPELTTEKAIKTTLELVTDINETFSLKALGYFQSVNDYIYLQPQGITLTIRGAFPEFEYRQTNANIYGFDLTTKWNITKSLFSDIKYSFIKGINTKENDISIINLPSNNLRLAVGYQFLKPIHIFNKNIENFEIGINSLHVARQSDILPEQDVEISPGEFVVPPSAYTLLGLSTAADIQLGKNRLRLTGRVNNLLNTSYREYLNRLRYFADDTGINIAVGAALKF